MAIGYRQSPIVPIARAGDFRMLRPLSAPVSMVASVPELIREAITAAGGAIPFARFMELALYAPEVGYYEQASHRVGLQGDFYTSVSVGPLLGELLGFQFAQWLDDLSAQARETPLHLVEAGAHDGRLAADLLGWLRTWRPNLFPRIQLWLIEPSLRRRSWQQQTLTDFGTTVNWVTDLMELQARTGGVCGVLYCNELLDAFPVHRIAWSVARQAWQEVGVAQAEGGFQWQPLPPGTKTGADTDRNHLSSLPRELLSVLPDGFALETSPTAREWWRAAADTLREGELVALDYGFDDDPVLRPEYPDGTLRAYRRHQVTRDVLTNPGDQDLTAQVDFKSVAAAGENAGLRTLFRTPQRLWLTSIFEATLAADSGFPPWDSGKIRQFQTLTHPEHLGRRFQVLAQTRPAPR